MSSSISGQTVRFPTRNVMQLVFALHILQEGQHATEFRHDGSLKARGVVSLDQTPRPFVQDRPNLHARR